MSAPQSSRKPLSTKGRALKAAVAAVAVAAAGGLVTAFSYARDPVRTSADALVTNYDLESGKPLHWQGMK
ncbi:MAG: hypothetical protein L6Q57_09965, partial [Alphaproteobacteria bacterium]|nr:hypothetical protein [Alphaproteobacteria bacterium]